MKKEELIAARVPAALVADLKKVEEFEQLDRSTTVRRLLSTALQDWKLHHAALQYQQQALTLAGAAEEAGVSVRQMMECIRKQKVPFQYDTEDFERDLTEIYARLQKTTKAP